MPEIPISDIQLSQINDLSTGTPSIANLSIKDILSYTGRVSPTSLSVVYVMDRAIILQEMMSKVDNVLVKGLAKDLIAVLTNWFEDPEVPCCLIQGIWATYAAAHQNTKLEFSIADTGFVKYLDVLIAFIDFIISLLTSDLKKAISFTPDILKEITDSVMQAIIAVLQEVLFSLRDSMINGLLQQMDGMLDNSSIWAKCLPLQQLLNVLKKYVNDYGLFAELMEKIKGLVAGKFNAFSFMKELNLPENTMNLEFLYWFRDLLIKIKQATINMELCVAYSYTPVGGTSSLNDSNVDDALNNHGDTANVDGSGQDAAQGIQVLSDGSILTDKNAKSNNISTISNSSIRTFLNKYYGYPFDVLDNMLTTSTSKDSIIGTDINSDVISNVNADCPNSPSPEEIVNWALRVRNRSLMNV